LSSRRLVDPPLDTNWETLSTQALKDEVKRAILGPSTWSVASPAPPTVYRSITVSLDDVRANGDLSPILLPGGRHIFVHIVEQGVRGVECRDVFSGRRLWSWVCPGRNVLYSTVDFAGRDYKATVGIVSEDGCDLASAHVSHPDFFELQEPPFLHRYCGSRFVNVRLERTLSSTHGFFFPLASDNIWRCLRLRAR
jgi:hypothetical protein